MVELGVRCVKGESAKRPLSKASLSKASQSLRCVTCPSLPTVPFQQKHKGPCVIRGARYGPGHCATQAGCVSLVRQAGGFFGNRGERLPQDPDLVALNSFRRPGAARREDAFPTLSQPRMKAWYCNFVGKLAECLAMRIKLFGSVCPVFNAAAPKKAKASWPEGLVDREVQSNALLHAVSRIISGQSGGLRLQAADLAHAQNAVSQVMS